MVSMWEVNFVLFNSMLRYVINRLMDAFFPYQDCYLPSTDIDPRAKVLWPIFVSHDENDPDMEKEMHNLYLSGNYRDMNITLSFLM
jgi:hypothetical protein